MYLSNKAGTYSTITDFITMLINGVSQSVVNYCGRDFIRAEHTEILDGNGDRTMYLRHYPILDALDSTTGSGAITVPNPVLSFDNDADDSWDTAISQGLTLKYIKSTGEIYLKDGYQFYEGRRNIKVVYTGGYFSAATVPQDLKMEAMNMIGTYKAQVENKLFGLQSESFAQESRSYDFNNWSANALRVLDRYRAILA